MKRHLLFAVLLSCSPLVLAGTDTVITKENGEVTKVEKVPTPPADAFMSFEEADKNGDGRIDKQEAHDAGVLNFGPADTDHSGYLDSQEYEAAGARSEPSFVKEQD